MKRALVLALLLAACNEINDRDAEGKLKELAEQQVAPVQSVSCPTAKRKKGVQFTCAVTFVGGTRGNLQVTLTDDDGNFDWVWVPWIVEATRLAEAIAGALKDQQPELGEVDVECGTGILEVPAEGVPCHVKAARVENDLMVKAGPDTIEWEIKK